MRTRSIGVVALVAGLAGCDPYRCLVESRAQQLELQTSSGRAAFSLSQTRGAEDGEFVMWHLRSSPLPAPATRVLLREGTPEAPGRVLYDFPLVNPVPDLGVITQVFTRAPYDGEVPFTELWDLVQRQPVSFEIVFAGGVAPLRIGPLSLTSSGDWQDVCT